ncbi:MAG TPA: alpha-amylase family glycosyl hydrolase [Aggregatilinea sp.]|uniref:alpha-amylase family glycosyl hydrolase n=1 Tax=Aggregatilinea sp. TaxID=2806333 RepID=UPI002C1C2D96|nr:alpha-amylase family glycosyl hydrolase [Aggregatilinea sp.]HML20277.1 alpha-amylase family glycosyl hydrolase [Aggregatilinea sp.]
MEDFIFGTLATDELKLVHHRTARQGIHHAHSLAPFDPKPGEPVTITTRIGPDLSASRVVCYYTLDGSTPEGSRGQAHNGLTLDLERVEVVWDTLLWGYSSIWQGTLPAQANGTIVRYRIGAWDGDNPETFADWPDIQLTAETAASAFFRHEALPNLTLGDPACGHIFTYHVDEHTAPQWARDAIIYQIFVDRFYPGDGKDWLQTGDMSGICGGTLWGVRDKLDYIADLGATCIWLSPIFNSPSHHGYDATDLYHIEPHLGGDESLHALVDAAHARGIRVLLDFVCNHISAQHPFFQDALSSPSSPYSEWFTFDDSPIGYRTFFEVPSMPQVNLAHPGAKEWMIDAARYWLRDYDVDGYRLDYANGPSPDFWPDFWAACKAIKPDSFSFGEVIDAPSLLRPYVGRLDGGLDFHLSDALRKTYGWKQWTESDLDRFLERHLSYFPSDFVMPTFLDSHDMDRFLFIAQDDIEALRKALAIQMRLPGPPIVYYGTEVGMSQTTGKNDGSMLEVSRAPMVWDARQDRDLLHYYKEQIQQRRENRGISA